MLNLISPTDDDDCEQDPCPIDKQCVDKVNSYICAWIEH